MNLIRIFNDKPNYIFYLLIFSFILLIRFPFFFVDFLDSDEATLILKGLAITQGKIPYVDFHNYKPPISGYFLTIPMYFADNSLFAIRFFTAIIVSLSSIFLYKICKIYNFSKSNSFLCSIIFGIVVSFVARSIKSQSFYSEHISVLLILVSFYLFLKILEKRNNFIFILQGLCLGIATLNTPYLALFAVIFSILPFFFLRNKTKEKLFSSISIIFGGFITLFIFLIYFYTKFPNIISYTISSALREFIYTVPETIYLLIGAGLHINSIKFFSAFFIWVLGFCGMLHIFYTKNFKKKYLILITVLIVLSFNIILILYPSGRYLIIIAPFFCILLFYLFSISFFQKYKIIKNLIILLIFFFPLIDWYNQILLLKKININEKTYTYGLCTNLYANLEKKNFLEKKVYYQDCHINYFFSNNLPILDVYHPDDIFHKDRMKPFNKKNLGDELFNKNPEILVLTEDLSKFVKNLNFVDINLNEVLKRFKISFKSSDFIIYQLKSK